MASGFGIVYVGLTISQRVPQAGSATESLKLGPRIASTARAGISTARAGVAMPGPHVPFLSARTGSVSDAWRRYFADLDRRMGGVLGPAVATVLAQAQAAETAAISAAVAANTAQVSASSVAQAVNVVREVAQLNALSGADQIPTQDP